MGYSDLHSKTVSRTTTLVAISRHVSSDLVGESVILNLNTGMYFGLNEVGASIWALLQQPITVDEICAAISQEYEVDTQQCEQETISLLQELVVAQLAEIQSGADA